KFDARRNGKKTSAGLPAMSNSCQDAIGPRLYVLRCASPLRQKFTLARRASEGRGTTDFRLQVGAPVHAGRRFPSLARRAGVQGHHQSNACMTLPERKSCVCSCRSTSVILSLQVVVEKSKERFVGLRGVL